MWWYTFEKVVGCTLFIIGACGLLIMNINPQWEGFDKIKKWFRQKGRK